MIITTIKIIINCIKQSNSGCIYIRVSSLAAVCCLWVVNCFFIIFLLCGSDPTCHLFCQHSDMSTHVCRCVCYKARGESGVCWLADFDAFDFFFQNLIQIRRFIQTDVAADEFEFETFNRIVREFSANFPVLRGDSSAAGGKWLRGLADRCCGDRGKLSGNLF